MFSMKAILFYLLIGCLINLFLAWQKALNHPLIALYFLFLWPVVIGRGLGKMFIQKIRGRKR